MKDTISLLGTDLTKNLTFSEVQTLLYILNEVIDHKALTKSNKEIAKDRKLSISTIEKHLKKLDREGLIERETVKARNKYTMNWETTSRSITIPADVLDPRIIAELHLNRIHTMLDLVITPEATLKQIEKMKQTRGAHAKQT